MSRWAGMCTLVALDSERDELGVQRKKERSRRVPCNEYSISQQAYYAAAQSGVRPMAVLEVRRCAYSGEKVCEYGGVRYTVDSAVASGADTLRLTLTEKVGNR